MPLVLPYFDTSLLIRTDFSDDGAWRGVCDAALAPSSPDGFVAVLDCVDDRRFEGMTAAQVVAVSGADEEPFFVFLADRFTFEHADRPIQVVDLRWAPGRTFRVVPERMWSVENNLSISNMDFEDFSSSVDADGIFRGF